MPSFTTFHAADLPPQDVAAILSDHLALDRARFWRRLLVVRFGLLALLVFAVAHLIPGVSTYGHWVPALLFLIAPVWASVAELRLARRLSHRLHASADVHTHTVDMESDTVVHRW